MKRKKFLTVVVILGFLLWVNFTFAQDWNSKLLDAAEKGDIEGVKTALAKGADVNAKDCFGKTALKLVKDRGHKDIVNYLRSVGGKE